MSDYIISCCSTADLTKEHFDDYSGATEPPFRKTQYRESGIAYRQSNSYCASLLA
ncbi:MAG: hypothetical protein K6G24_05995 [Lachnospiraceae bacterium]|nr:hypothetical protein [Lachnospiraceae bacterium]